MAEGTVPAEHQSGIAVATQRIYGAEKSSSAQGKLQTTFGSGETALTTNLHTCSDLIRQSVDDTVYMSSDGESQQSAVPDVMSMKSDDSLHRIINFAEGDNGEEEGVSCSACGARAYKSCFTCMASFCECHARSHYKGLEFKSHLLVDASEKILSAHSRFGPIELTSVKPDSVSLSWGPLEGSTGLEKFRINWNCDEDQQSVELSDFRFTVEELIPGTTYTFSVAELMDDGTQGVCVFAKAHTGIPQPEDVTVTTDLTSLTVSWRKPAGVDQIKYLLSLYSHGKCLTTISLTSPQRCFSELLMGEEYTISVCTLLKKGGQSNPVWKTIKTRNEPSGGKNESNQEPQPVLTSETMKEAAAPPREWRWRQWRPWTMWPWRSILKGPHERLEELMKNSHLIASGARKVYILTTKQTTLNDTVRRWTFGERDNSKKNKIIMLVGETGTGKTTLINTLVNHALGVKFNDDVWFEISEEDKNSKQTKSQTTHVTVYDVFVKDSPFSLTIIDTPGYGDTRGLLFDQLITENLLTLFRSEDGVHTVDAICLVLKASTNRLSTTQHYIFNAVLSVFGKDMQENIVLLITNSNGQKPENALQAVQEGKVPCARTSEGPVYFLFDNCQLGAFEEESQSSAEHSWNLSVKNIEKWYEFIDRQERKSMELTTGVLKERVQLKACVNNLMERIEFIELKQKELKQTQAAIEDNQEKIKTCEKFTYEVDVPYKVKHDIQISGNIFTYYPQLIWKYFTDRAVCCTECEETCHYPGCWLSLFTQHCEVMQANHCTVCTKKCHYSKHVKENWRYIIKTRKETRTDEDLKRRFEEQTDRSKSYEKMLRKAEEDLEKETAEKCRLVHEAYQSIMKLQEIALERDSVFTLVHLDFLIEKMQEMGDTEKVRKLEEMQKTDEAKQSAVNYVKAFVM